MRFIEINFIGASPYDPIHIKLIFTQLYYLYTMDWRTKLSEEIQQMKHRNNSSRFAGGWGYTSANIEDGRRENERIDKYAKDQIDHFHTSELKTLQNDLEAKNKYLKDILLALPYIKDDIQSILDKYPPVFQIEKAGIIKDPYLYSATYLTDCPGISTIKTSISGCMLTDLYEAFAKSLISIKKDIHSQEDIDCADRIYNKSTVLEGPNKSVYDNIISRTQALHYIYKRNQITELLVEHGISHEYIDKLPYIPEVSLEHYGKIGTKYLHVFIDSKIDRQVDDICLDNYGEMRLDELRAIKYNCLHDIRTTTRINKLSKLELKRQERERIDAEVQRRLEKEEFEKKVVVRLQEKKKSIQKNPPIQKKHPIHENVIVKLQEKKPTIEMKDSIENYIERMDKDISRISLLGEL